MSIFFNFNWCSLNVACAFKMQLICNKDIFYNIRFTIECLRDARVINNNWAVLVQCKLQRTWIFKTLCTLEIQIVHTRSEYTTQLFSSRRLGAMFRRYGGFANDHKDVVLTPSCHDDDDGRLVYRSMPI